MLRKSLLFVLVKSHNLVFSRVVFFCVFNKGSKLEQLIFLCFLKRGKQNQAKETKQTKNKVKRKEVEDSPCEDVLSLPDNDARKLVDGSVVVEPVGNPKSKV